MDPKPSLLRELNDITRLRGGEDLCNNPSSKSCAICTSKHTGSRHIHHFALGK